MFCLNPLIGWTKFNSIKPSIHRLTRMPSLKLTRNAAFYSIFSALCGLKKVTNENQDKTKFHPHYQNARITGWVNFKDGAQ